MMKVLSLFSGIGAFEKALDNLGCEYEIANYCEIDKFVSYAYSVLHKIDESKNLGDISKVDTNKIDSIDLVTYGFPCQDISLAGERKGIIKGKTRSGLLYEALRVIEDKKPKVAIAENVKNLVSKMFIKDFENLLSILDKLGYNSYWKILNSKDYGSVQSRERVFIVSIRKDVDNGRFNFPPVIPNNRKLSEVLDIKVPNKYYCKDNSYFNSFIKDVKRKIVNFKKPSQYGVLKVGEINNPNMLDMNKRVFLDDGLSPTLLTGSDSIPKILQIRVRKLTPLECWRATGFEDEDYCKVRIALEEKFYNGKDMTDTQMYKMAGNSIVVEVIEKILNELINKEII
ncbi:DNA (cytosine-5-)-methyltransferase [Clostridium tertium]|uniref:DNA (cytosine-5-)-methyltransferase n=1 Tax=Clostridium tertium TaxID=1559 RepID=UPI0023309DF9|nr:DNA (cytosine-5-)-methyltransferase [Clostridium tertium]MDB1923379.1 DNA (cytosine-5-)-methyltransferase [Clostridium tertium]MDB1929984.1 DNA (cytosine-5-)-methyltransferase [Clostridium tertium]